MKSKTIMKYGFIWQITLVFLMLSTQWEWYYCISIITISAICLFVPFIHLTIKEDKKKHQTNSGK